MLLEKQGTYGRLQRLQAGESLEKLVAEYEGVVIEDEVVDATAVAAVAAAVAEADAAVAEEE